jgi:hypothetical protein
MLRILRRIRMDGVRARCKTCGRKTYVGELSGQCLICLDNYWDEQTYLDGWK